MRLTHLSFAICCSQVSVFTQQSSSTGTFVIKREPVILPDSVESPTSGDELLKNFESAPLTRHTSDSDCSRFMLGAHLPDALEGSQGGTGEADETETTGFSGSGYDRPKLPFEQHSPVEMSPGDTPYGYRN